MIDEEHQWQLFCNGEMKALEVFYRKYYALLYNYGLKLLDDPFVVQDCVQEVFYKLCKRKHNEDIVNLKVFLLRAMRNLIYDHYATRHEAVSIDDMRFMLPADEELFESFFGKDDETLLRWRQVLDSINKLPNQQKQVLYLYYIKGCSHKEIGEVMDIHAQSSMNALSKAMKTLRAWLDKDTLPALLLLFESLS